MANNENVVEGVDALTLNENEQDEDLVDPWNVTCKSDTGIDYDKLISMLCVYLHIFHFFYDEIINKYYFRKIWFIEN